jgi:hypothetical protein
MFSRRLSKALALVAATVAVGGGAYGIVSATASNGAATTTTSSLFGRSGSNARSGPAAGGSVGTVQSISTSGFTLLTAGGQKVTVTSTQAIKKGQRVLVLGTVSGTTIKATQVVRTNAATATKVVPFQRGAQSTAKQVGKIPANYTEGSGTIVGGTAANKATRAALTAYAGGIVDRVVKLSNGEYEVHNIGVNWPHHIFVSASFKVLGAD